MADTFAMRATVLTPDHTDGAPGAVTVTAGTKYTLLIVGLKSEPNEPRAMIRMTRDERLALIAMLSQEDSRG